MRNLLLGVLTVLVILAEGGCATLMRGNKQKVKLVTDPPAADIIVDGKSYTSPAEVVLKRKRPHDITVSKAGCQAIKFKLNSHWDAGGAGAGVLHAAVPGG